MTLQNEKFEELIGEHLKATLDGQRGRAAAAFREELAAERTNDGGRDTRVTGMHKVIPLRALWWWTGVPSVAAAGLAVVVMLQLGGGGVLGRKTTIMDPTAKAGGGGGGLVASSVEVLQNQTGGIVVNDDKPMREVRQQIIRETRWVDPNDHAEYKLTEPTEKVNYILVQPN